MVMGDYSTKDIDLIESLEAELQEIDEDIGGDNTLDIDF